MKTNEEILNEFGKKIINDVYDDGLNYFNQLVTNSTKWGTGKEYSDILNKLSEHDRLRLSEYVKSILSTSIFGVLKIFEENSQFKILYEENGEQVDLVKISEDLKAEPIIQNGWIERFSKEK